MDAEFLNRIETVSEYFTIPQLLPQLHIGNNDCPNCGGKAKLSVSAKVARCWKPCCSWNKGLPLVKFYQEYQGIKFFEALEFLESEAGIATDSNKIQKRTDVLIKLKALYQFYLNLAPHQEVKEYLIERGITSSAINKLGIGYAPHGNCITQVNKIAPADLELLEFKTKSGQEFFSNRIIFPIVDYQQQLVHLQGRYYGQIPQRNGEALCGKYKNTASFPGIPSTSKYLALENFLDSYTEDSLYICEGFPDTISLWQIGLPAVGVLGLGGINNHLYKFRRFKHLIFCFDNDRYESDHDTHPNAYKSWLLVIPQLIELQLQLPKTKISVFIPPENQPGIKDINDLYLNYSQAELTDLLQTEAKELVGFLTQVWGKNLKKHHLLIQLLKVKDNLSLLDPYLPAVPTLEYTSLILDYATA